MKNIDFKKTGMENFCCYTNLMEYEFKNNKVILITGPNGVGKSSINDSVLFTLFGITSKDAKGTDVVNNIVGKNCHTYVEFTSENSGVIDKYRVDRYVKHSKFGDTVFITKNDEDKPYKKGHREVLPEIERILVPQKLFTNTLLFGQKVKDFFTDLPDSERKEIFRKVLQLDNYVLYQDETNKRIKIVTLEIDEIDSKMKLNYKLLENSINNIKLTNEDIKNFEIRKTTEIKGLIQKIKVFEDELSGLNERLKFYEKFNDLELSELNNKILTIQNDINTLNLELKNQIDSLTNMKNSKESEFESKSKELISNEKLKETKLISEEENSYQQSNIKLEKESFELITNKNQSIETISSNEAKIEKNNEEIVNLETSLNKSEMTCPTCGKPLTDKSIINRLQTTLRCVISENEKLTEENENRRKLIKESNDKIVKLNNNKTKLKSTFDTKKLEIQKNFDDKQKEINDKLIDAKQKLITLFYEKKNTIEKDFSSKTKNLKKELDELDLNRHELIKFLKDKKELTDQLNTVQSEIKLNKQLIINKKKEEYNLSILNGYITEKEKLENELTKLISDKRILEEKLEILTFWKSGFSSTGIPSLLIDESIPFLNERVDNYLEMIGGRYKVSFDTISTTKSGEYRDKINVNVLDTQTKANNRKQLSGGQTRIIDIAILLSLCDLQNNVQDMKTNILLLDEIFDALDDQNIGYVSNLLRTLVIDKSINIISHRHIDSIEADEVMRLF